MFPLECFMEEIIMVITQCFSATCILGANSTTHIRSNASVEAEQGNKKLLKKILQYSNSDKRGVDEVNDSLCDLKIEIAFDSTSFRLGLVL